MPANVKERDPELDLAAALWFEELLWLFRKEIRSSSEPAVEPQSQETFGCLLPSVGPPQFDVGK